MARYLVLVALTAGAAAWFFLSDEEPQVAAREKEQSTHTLPSNDALKERKAQPKVVEHSTRRADALFAEARARGEWRAEDEQEFQELLARIPLNEQEAVALAHFHVVDELVKPLAQPHAINP